MSALAFVNLNDEDGGNLRRWAISVAVALLVHGAIAAAIFNWHNSITSIGPAAPFTIDLLPLPGAPGPQQNEFQAGAALDGIGGSSAPERIITNAPTREPSERAQGIGADKTTANGEGSAEPVAAPPNRTAPVVLTPAKDAEEDKSVETRAVSGGGGASYAAPSTGHGGSTAAPSPPAASLMDTPLDTSITVMPGLYGKKAGAGMGRQKKNIVLLRPSKHSIVPQHPPSLRPATGPTTVTNALGAHVQDRVRAALARANRSATTKNAIGGAIATSPAGGSNANAAEGVATNAIGMTVHVRPGLAGTNIGENRTAPSASAGTATNRFVINGRDMIRPGLGGAVIGGPARNVIGVINGTNFRVRQP